MPNASPEPTLESRAAPIQGDAAHDPVGDPTPDVSTALLEQFVRTLARQAAREHVQSQAKETQ